MSRDVKTKLSSITSLLSSHPCKFSLLVISFGIAAMLPVYFWGMPAGADFDNHFRFVMPFYDELRQGNLMPGWLAESNYGFGDPRFRFYPPTLYYILCFFRFAIGDWYFATLLTFTLFSALGALGVYFWTRRSLSDQTAVLAALIFTIAPYHLAQFYQASLLAEYAAAALLPFAFMFVEKLTARKDKAERSVGNLSEVLLNTAGLAIVYALIVTIHLPVTVIGSLSLGLYALLLTDWKNNKKALVFCALGICLGLLASSWFWVRMIGELGWIQAGENVSSPHYDYRNNFIFSPFSLGNLNTWYASLVSALTVGIFLPSLLIIRQILSFKSKDAIVKYFADGENSFQIKRRLSAALIIAFLTFLMMTDLSRPLWAIIPKLKDIQFPFRWLTIVSITICPIVALSLQIWRERFKGKNIRPVHLVLIAGFILSIFWTAKDLVIESGYLSRPEFAERIEKRRGGRSFNDWLPRGAREFKDLVPLEGKADAGKRQVTITDWQAQKRNFSIEAGDETQVRLRSYYYPLWQAFAITNEGRTPLTVGKAEDGTLLITIPPESVDVELNFVEPSSTKISIVAAAFGWMAALALLAMSFTRKLKKQFEK